MHNSATLHYLFLQKGISCQIPKNHIKTFLRQFIHILGYSHNYLFSSFHIDYTLSSKAQLAEDIPIFNKANSRQATPRPASQVPFPEAIFKRVNIPFLNIVVDDTFILLVLHRHKTYNMFIIQSNKPLVLFDVRKGNCSSVSALRAHNQRG